MHLLNLIKKLYEVDIEASICHAMLANQNIIKNNEFENPVGTFKNKG